MALLLLAAIMPVTAGVISSGYVRGSYRPDLEGQISFPGTFQFTGNGFNFGGDFGAGNAGGFVSCNFIPACPTVDPQFRLLDVGFPGILGLFDGYVVLSGPPVPLGNLSIGLNTLKATFTLSGQFDRPGAFNNGPSVPLYAPYTQPLTGSGLAFLTLDYEINPNTKAGSYVPVSVEYDFIAVPEPSTVLLSLLGAACLPALSYAGRIRSAGTSTWLKPLNENSSSTR
ncbi:MAG: hypothetical protein ACR2I2_10845 [Bryobacteraceae bacterium]